MTTVQLITTLTQMLGGVGILLFGMKYMGDGLELVAGSRMKRIIEKVTANPFLAVLVGVVVTAVIQSSAATVVMVMGFLNAKLLGNKQAFYIIIGANIGTTVTSFLIGLNIGTAAPVLIFVGAVMLLFLKKKIANHIGMVLMGFGMLFMGMTNMKEAMSVFQDLPAFSQAMQLFSSNPLLGMLLGVLMAAVLQSSSAGVGIVQAMVAAGVIAPVGALYNVFGQNIGTCVTGLLASIGSQIAGKRAAITNLMVNAIGTLVLLPLCLLIGPELLVSLAQNVAPDSPEMQVALFHISFNLANTLIIFPLVGPLSRLTEKLVVDKSSNEEEPLELRYLDERILNTPAVAVAQVEKEVERMALLARDNVALALDDYFAPDADKHARVEDNEKVVNYLNHTITDYLIRIHALDLTETDSAVVGSLFHVVNDLERISDHAENIMGYARADGDEPPAFSEDALQELHEMQQRTMHVLNDSIAFFTQRDADSVVADSIIEQEEEIDGMVLVCRENHVRRMQQSQSLIDRSMTVIDLLTDLERISDHATNIMYAAYVR